MRSNVPLKVVVFGSNLRGIHGAGAALQARRQWGAVQGLGVGLQGMSYAIPTKETPSTVLPRTIIALYVAQFCKYAELHHLYSTGVTFIVTRIGCGLAGYKDKEIAPLFAHCPPNCQFDTKWKPWLGDLHKYWGTYP